MSILTDRLNEDKILNSDVLEVLRRKSGLILYESADGFLVYDKVSGTNYMSADSLEVAEHIFNFVTDGFLFCVHEDIYVPLIEKRFSVSLGLECFQALYNRTEPAEMPPGEYIIKKLDESHTSIIKTNYTVIGTPGYIEGRIKEGMYGAFFGDDMAGFVGKHEEGSIGMLYVFEKYRRRSIASALTSHMVNMCMENGCIPYSQVTVSNEASYAFHKKAGFEISEKKVYWLY